MRPRYSRSNINRPLQPTLSEVDLFMTERFPNSSLSYEPLAYEQPERLPTKATLLEDDVNIGFHESTLGTPAEGRLRARAQAEAALRNTTERSSSEYGFENIGRRAELLRYYRDYELAA